MRQRLLPFLLLTLCALMLATAGCRKSAPVQNIGEHPFPPTNSKLTDDNVKNAIVRAGIDLGWAMAAVAPGEMTGTLHLRAHTAVVTIKYSLKERFYSILYKSSQNLDYKDGKIHPNYNNWIINLTNNIDREILLIP